MMFLLKTLNYDIVVVCQCLAIGVLNLASEDENNSYRPIYLPHDILKIPNCNYIQSRLLY